MTNGNETDLAQRKEAYGRYLEARATYDMAWDFYVHAPGDRAQARAKLAEARKVLEEATGASRSACYYALDPNGRFAKHLDHFGGKITWK
jgi:hypothetical protein